MADSLPPARDGVEQRLDAILAALAALRADVQALRPAPLDLIPGTIELREIERPRRGRRA